MTQPSSHVVVDLADEPCQRDPQAPFAAVWEGIPKAGFLEFGLPETPGCQTVLVQTLLLVVLLNIQDLLKKEASRLFHYFYFSIRNCWEERDHAEQNSNIMQP